MTAYTHLFWTRATKETRVKLGDLDELVLTLVDHGSKICIVSRKIYEKGKWPTDVNYGMVLRAANIDRGNLYGICPAVKTKIGDMEMEQNFLCKTMKVIQSFLVSFISQQPEQKQLEHGLYKMLP